MVDATTAAVTRLMDVSVLAVAQLLSRFGLKLRQVALTATIPGSYWGDSEAGLIGDQLFCRADTPVHSILHEGSHYICMDGLRRAQLHTDAGGTYAEEDAVCALQIVLAEHLAGMSPQRMMQDMDTWGYTFRLGSTRAWFEQDAADAKRWLRQQRLVDAADQPCWRVRDESAARARKLSWR